MRTRWSKELVLTRIQRLHRAGRKLDSTTASKQFRILMRAADKYLGGWRQAIEAAGIDYWGTVSRIAKPERWNKHRVVQEIRRRHAAGEKLNSNYCQLCVHSLYAAAVRYFKSWSNAIQAAGLDSIAVRVRPVFRSWSKERIARTIQRRWRKGLPLNTTAVVEQDYALYHASVRYFGNPNCWKKALRFSGINPSEVYVKPHWTKGLVYRCIRELRRAHIPLNFCYLQAHGHRQLVNAGARLYGNWGKAVNAARLNYARIQRKRLWDKKKVLCVIRRLNKERVRLSSKATQHSYGNLFGAAAVFFGSWSQAVEAAGIPYRKHCLTWSYKAWLRNLTASKRNKIERQAMQFAKERRSVQ